MPSRYNEETGPHSIDGSILGPSPLIDPENNEAPILNVLEYMAWGRNFSGCNMAAIRAPVGPDGVVDGM